MFSIDEFKRDYVPFLKEPDKIVLFHQAHYHMIELNKFDQEYKDHIPDYDKYLGAYTQRGLAYTGMSEGTIYAIFGFHYLHKGAAEFFLIPSVHINKKAMVFHKVSLQFFEYVGKKMNLNRLQFTVCCRNFRAIKWAKSCKFNEEGILKKYGILAADYIMFARYFERT